jgi:N-acetylmuramoyl-L-alanine amidase
MPSFGRSRRFARAGLKTRPYVAALLLAAVLLPAVAHAQSQIAALYKEALARETALRKQLDVVPASSPAATDLHTRMRTLSKTYEDLWRLFPPNGYSDNAIWQAAMLAADGFWEFGDAAERTRALRLFQALTANFPTSSLVKQVPAQIDRLESAKRPVAPAPKVSGAPRPAAPASTAAAPVAIATTTPNTPAAPVTLTAIRREVLPDTLRVTLELEREPMFHAERIDGPPRVFIDLQNTRAIDSLKDASLPFPDDLVRQIRVGRQLDARTRVVLDLSAAAARYSIYSLYNPYRIVIDFARKAPAPPATPAHVERAAATPEPGATWTQPVAPAAVVPAPLPPVVQPAVEAVATTAAPPLPPATNSSGTFSLSRQLGLGISRIVIDAGHGGHDPGARIKGLTEADVTLDVALRLQKLLQKQPGVEVLLTRRDDTFVPLAERTAIANRAEADLFLSIHVNAGESPSLRGIETYFLNLSANPAAQRIAARENASSQKTMHDLGDIVKAIALTDKIDESRDFAAAVQSSMVEKLKAAHKDTRNLGVKQAPFAVLIGARMPSILAEVSFITNKDEGARLKTAKYRQQIAEALYQGVLRYQQSLKNVSAIAAVRP